MDSIAAIDLPIGADLPYLSKYASIVFATNPASLAAYLFAVLASNPELTYFCFIDSKNGYNNCPFSPNCLAKAIDLIDLLVILLNILATSLTK